MESNVPFKDALNDIFENRLFKKQLILWYRFAKNLNAKEIEEQTSIPIQSIYSFLQKWKNTGKIQDDERSGRPKILTEKQQQKIIDIQTNDRFKTSATIYREIANDSSLGISKKSVNYKQVLREVNKNFKLTIAVYQIKLSEQNRYKRLKFIEDWKKFRYWKINTIVWTDEKIFRLMPQRKKFVVKLKDFEKKSDFPLEKKQNEGGGVMFWGAISDKGKILLSRLEGKITSFSFKFFLEHKAIPAIENVMGKSYIFMQDNAPAHKGEALKFLQKSNISILDWPPQSPDINPIEQVWMWMQSKIGPKQFISQYELIDYIMDLWEKMPNELIQKFVKSIPDRLQWIEDNEGYIYNP